MKINVRSKSDGTYLYKNLIVSNIMMGAYKGDTEYILFFDNGESILIDITEYEIETVETEVPPQRELRLSEIKSQAIVQTKKWIVRTLETPIEYNGKFYSVTEKKQNLLSAQLGLFMMNKQLGNPYQLTWNDTGESCEPWEFEDLLLLANAIDAHVKPIIKKQQDAEKDITGAESAEAVNEILADFV